MDPKFEAFIDTLNEDNEPVVSEDKSEEDVPASDGSQTVDGWLEKQGLSVWPVHVEDERNFVVTPEDVGVESLEGIMNELALDVPLDMSLIDEILEEVEKLEVRVLECVSKLLNIQVTSENLESCFSPERELQTRITPPVLAHYRRKTEVVLWTTQKVVKGAESPIHKAKTVDNITYFGFIPDELSPLPGQLESQKLLNKVTQLQNFSQPFRTVWKKAILSDPSVAVFQDAFWCFFCHNFQEDQAIDEIFSRISDSFVALFFTVQPGYKDHFFELYPNCLAQALYVAFCEAFPQSLDLFGDYFKSCLLDTVCEWVWGIKLSPQSWRGWPTHDLEPNELHLPFENPKPIHMDLSFDMDSLLQEGQPPSPVEANKPAVLLQPLELGKTKLHKQSHPIGQSPIFTKARFNIIGQSPLVSHFLSVKGLKTGSSKSLKKSVKRSEIAEQSNSCVTYNDVIRERKKQSRLMAQQYQLTLQASAEEGQKIEKQKQEVLASINQLESDLTRRHSDFKALSEKIYGTTTNSSNCQ